MYVYCAMSVCVCVCVSVLCVKNYLVLVTNRFSFAWPVFFLLNSKIFSFFSLATVQFSFRFHPDIIHLYWISPISTYCSVYASLSFSFEAFKISLKSWFFFLSSLALSLFIYPSFDLIVLIDNNCIKKFSSPKERKPSRYTASLVSVFLHEHQHISGAIVFFFYSYSFFFVAVIVVIHFCVCLFILVNFLLRFTRIYHAHTSIHTWRKMQKC